MKLPVVQNGTTNAPRTREDLLAHRIACEEASPQEIVEWSLARFAGQRVVSTTGFGMEGCALIDMLHHAGARIDVIYLDTHFLFDETLRLRDTLAQRYPTLNFVNKGTDLTPEQQAQRLGDELWKREPDTCCDIRKVRPMKAALRGADVWLTAIRRSQSPARAATKLVDWDWQYQLVKISPLALWDRKQVWGYIKEHNVPYNPLHEQGYPTVGCTHCTKPVHGSTVDSYSRAGRWAGVEKTECGLHDGAGI